MTTPPSERALIAAAVRAARRAHAPYSGFRVGAALRTATGRIVTGGNVENASYGLTLCAERAAVARALAQGHSRFSALAVAAGQGDPVYPCGACLQVLAEFCPPDFPILLAPLDRPGLVTRVTLGRLLPKAFRFRPARETR